MTPDHSYATHSHPAQTEPETPPKSFVSRLVGAWFSPGETFAEVGRAPRPLLPLIALVVLTAISSFLLINRIGVSRFFGQGLEKAVASGRITQEQANQQLEAMTKREGIIKASFPLTGAVGALLVTLVIAGAFKLVTMVLGKDNGFGQVLSVTAYALLAVGIVQMVVMVALLYLKSPDDLDIQNLIGSNLGALLTMVTSENSLPKFVTALAAYVDVFALWKLVLLAIGYAAVTPKLKTSTAAGALGALYAIVAVIGAAWTAFRG